MLLVADDLVEAALTISDHAPADAELVGVFPVPAVRPGTDACLPCLLLFRWFILLPLLADRKEGAAARLPPEPLVLA